MTREAARPGRGSDDLLEVLLQGVVFRDVGQADLAMSSDDREQVVEVVGDTSHQPPQHLELLRLAQAFLTLGQQPFRGHSIRDIVPDDRDAGNLPRRVPEREEVIPVVSLPARCARQTLFHVEGRAALDTALHVPAESFDEITGVGLRPDKPRSGVHSLRAPMRTWESRFAGLHEPKSGIEQGRPARQELHEVLEEPDLLRRCPLRFLRLGGRRFECGRYTLDDPAGSAIASGVHVAPRCATTGQGDRPKLAPSESDPNVDEEKSAQGEGPAHQRDFHPFGYQEPDAQRDDPGQTRHDHRSQPERVESRQTDAVDFMRWHGTCRIGRTLKHILTVQSGSHLSRKNIDRAMLILERRPLRSVS